MDVKEILFSVNDNDYEGDVIESGVYLHFGDVRIKVADDLNGFKAFVKRIAGMTEEIADNINR